MGRITAIVCTHNRAGYLRRALESLAAQTLSPRDYEILVVDNASTDETPQIVHGLSEEIANLRYIREEHLGLSRARNTGAAAASTPYIAYMDDDARAEPNWLHTLLTSFKGLVPAPACVGGRVLLDWGGDPPRWLPRRYWSVYTYVDHPGGNHWLGEQEYLAGANMAFRRDDLLSLGGFPVNLGRRGSCLLSGEEAAVIQTLREKRLGVFYTADAVVLHAVPQTRLRRSWLRNRMFWDGASQPLLDWSCHQPRRGFVLHAYRDLRRIGSFAFQCLEAFLRGDRERRFDTALSVIQQAGRLRTHILLARGQQ